MHEAEIPVTRRFRIIAGGCGGLAALLGGVGLVSGLAGWSTLTSYFENAIPMALSTASLFCLIGTILAFFFARTRRAPRRAAFACMAFIVFSEGLLDALEVPLQLPGSFDPLDKLFFGVQSFLSIPHVSMSPLTGLLFSLSGGALLILLWRPRGRGDIWLDIAGLLATALILASLTLCLGYIYGAPLLYGSQFIPVSASTALAFVVTGLGIVCASGAGSLPLRPFLGVSIRATLLRVFTPTVFFIVLFYPLVHQTIAGFLPINNAILGSIMAMALAGAASVIVFRMGAGIGQRIDYSDAQRRIAEEKLARTNAALEAKNAELEQVVYVASHDLRSPLVNIDGYSKELDYALGDLRRALAGIPAAEETLRGLAPLLDEDIPEALRFIRISASKMDVLLSGLLHLSRSGRAALEFKTLDMNQLVSKIAASTEFTIKEAKITLEIKDLPPCHGDAVQVGQVFSNLLENAIKYLDPGRPGIIRISGRSEGERSVYCVEDNGIGIAPAHLNKIFEVFHRLDPRRGDGEGLGLTIVKRILARLGGEVWVESEEGSGSRFHVALPKSRRQ